MIDMEFIYADLLSPSQLLEGDFIKLDDEIVQIDTISDDSTGDVYFVKFTNDFGEHDIAELNYDDKIELFVIEE